MLRSASAQEKCAHVLLLRGADKDMKNYSSQSPFQVALISGNFELAELIKNHRDPEPVGLSDTPSASRGRRPLPRSGVCMSRSLLRSSSDINVPERTVSPELQQMQRDAGARMRMMMMTSGRSGRMKSNSRSLSVSLEDEHSSSTTLKCPNGRVCVPSSRRKLYSATSGRHVLLVRSCLPHAGGGENSSLHRNGRVRDSRAERSDRKKLFRHFTVGSYDSMDNSSDCTTEQKTVVLQKQDSEGFGFVLRGAKADTPIEEFIPTAAFPALQYLESVDEGGVAWLMGLRTGDFLTEVNHQSVVKMGHRQVVSMIKHGGNRLVIKVVRVSRNPDDKDDKTRKKAPPPPKRAPTTALTMRSKSMTCELEDPDKVEEAVPPQKIMHEKSSADKTVSIRSRPSSRFLASMDFNQSASERPGVAVVPPNVPGRSHGGYIRLPKSSMRRQKSVGIAGEEKKFLIPPLLKFSRSLSMPDTSEDIPPPPGISPPSPPYKLSTSTAQGYEPNQSIYTQNSAARCHTIERDQVGYHRQNFEPYDCQTHPGLNRAHVPENPYSDKPLYVPPKPARRKGILVKQPNVEDSPEKTCSISIPTIIVKEPSTSSSGKSSRGSSMEIETTGPEPPGQLRPDGSVSNPFAAAIAGAVRDREKRLEARKNSPAFLSMDLGDEDPFIPTPRLRQSMSIDEGMFANDKSLENIMAPPASLIGSSQLRNEGNLTDFTIPEPMTKPLTTRSRKCPDIGSPIGIDDDFQQQVSRKTHDICSPPAPGQSSGNKALKEPVLPPLPPPKGEPHKANLNQPLFIDTKLRSNIETNFAATTAVGQPKDSGGLFRHSRESSRQTVKVSNPSEQLKNAHNTSQQKSAGLLMVQSLNKAKPQGNSLSDGFLLEESPVMDGEPSDSKLPNSQTTPMEEPGKFSSGIPLPLLTSVDIDEEFDVAEPLPPPLEFANSLDIPEDQVAVILKQKKNNETRAVHHSRASNCMTSHAYPPPPPEMFEPVTDSGIEEADSRNSAGDPHFEANSTISTVSSISTLSSEGIEDACITYANGQIFLLDRPPVPPKPKSKPIINKSNAFYRDPLKQESIESIGEPPPLPPPPLCGVAQTEARKTLAKHPQELPNPLLPNADPKANVINELSSKLQHMNKDRFPKQGGSLDPPAVSRSIGSREWMAQDTKRIHKVSSSPLPPQASPPAGSGHSSLPGSAASPTLTDVFSLPSPPMGNAEQCFSISSVSSQSLSPLTLFQAAADKPFADKPIPLWSKHDVADWLDTLNLAEHKKAFLENDIEGSHLPNLQKEDLVDLGVTRVGHRMNIEKALKLLMDR
ncbi:SH3 and multiple ankyrin repeat domains protein 2 isoform X4 [Danio rerio]|uniref:SH3 and multiple ankyrin repeat domains protein 2 isoform X4 n=1 Tax=Danio rerio TaxID=7955 RepID=A0AC58HV54_DANRE